MDELFPEIKKAKVVKVNPQVLAYGKGPEGVKCGDCQHFFEVATYGGKKFRCDFSPSPHRKRWSACRKFKPNEDKPRIYDGR